jgi:hypothetical protein
MADAAPEQLDGTGLSCPTTPLHSSAHSFQVSSNSILGSSRSRMPSNRDLLTLSVGLTRSMSLKAVSRNSVGFVQDSSDLIRLNTERVCRATRNSASMSAKTAISPIGSGRPMRSRPISLAISVSNGYALAMLTTIDKSQIIGTEKPIR